MDIEWRLRVLEQHFIETVREFLRELAEVVCDTRALVGLQRKFVRPGTTRDAQPFLALLRELRVQSFVEAFAQRGDTLDVQYYG